MIPQDIFDRRTRRLLADRVQASKPEDRWLIRRMADEIIERIASVKAPFRDCLILGHGDDNLIAELRARNIAARLASPGANSARTCDGVQCDEDRLPFANHSFDLVIGLGTLDTVNDLPGALALVRRILRPDGLFLGAMAGAGSLLAFRAALNANPEQTQGVARMHPAIDVKAAGDLLARAGFALPVADADVVTARYRNPQRLFADLRANGLTNALAQRAMIGNREYAGLVAALSSAEIHESFAIIYLTGWASASR